MSTIPIIKELIHSIGLPYDPQRRDCSVLFDYLSFICLTSVTSLELDECRSRILNREWSFGFVFESLQFCLNLVTSFCLLIYFRRIFKIGFCLLCIAILSSVVFKTNCLVNIMKRIRLFDVLNTIYHMLDLIVQ